MHAILSRLAGFAENEFKARLPRISPLPRRAALSKSRNC